MYSHSLCPQKRRNKMCGLDSLTDLLLRIAAGPCHLYHNHQWPWVLAVVLDISHFPSQTSIVTSCKALDLIHKIIAQTSSLWNSSSVSGFKWRSLRGTQESDSHPPRFSGNFYPGPTHKIQIIKDNYRNTYLLAFKICLSSLLAYGFGML